MKVLMIAPHKKAYTNFRKNIIAKMLEMDWEIHLIAPEECGDILDILKVSYYTLPFNRISMNLLKDVKYIKEMNQLIKTIKPDIIISEGFKPNLFSSICKIRNREIDLYLLINGLGSVFDTYSLKKRFIKKIGELLYTCLIVSSTRTFFQNWDDLNLFDSKKIIKSGKCVHINGSGVDMEHYNSLKYPDKTSFIMICRLIKEKGVLEYLEAAEIVKSEYPEVEFKLAGGFDDNPNSLSYDDVEKYISNGTISYLNSVTDVRPLIESSSVFILPTYYNEGLPRTILECMAMKRAIITSDWKGCRDAVNDNVNGFLSKPKDIDSLVKNINHFIIQPELIKKMGRKSYNICKRKYEVNQVSESMLKVISRGRD